MIGEYNSHAKTRMDGRNEMLARLDQLNKELSKARRLMLNDEITAAEYREIKAEYQPEIKKGHSSNISEMSLKVTL